MFNIRHRILLAAIANCMAPIGTHHIPEHPGVALHNASQFCLSAQCSQTLITPMTADLTTSGNGSVICDACSFARVWQPPGYNDILLAQSTFHLAPAADKSSSTEFPSGATRDLRGQWEMLKKLVSRDSYGEHVTIDLSSCAGRHAGVFADDTVTTYAVLQLSFRPDTIKKRYFVGTTNLFNSHKRQRLTYNPFRGEKLWFPKDLKVTFDVGSKYIDTDWPEVANDGITVISQLTIPAVISQEIDLSKFHVRLACANENGCPGGVYEGSMSLYCPRIAPSHLRQVIRYSSQMEEESLRARLAHRTLASL